MWVKKKWWGWRFIWHGNSSGLNAGWLLKVNSWRHSIKPQLDLWTMANLGRLHRLIISACVRLRDTYSIMVSRSAMLPSTMRCMMEPCSSSDRLRWDTRGVDSLVAGEGSTPWSHWWRSISSKVARFLGSLWSMWAIRLEVVTKGISAVMELQKCFITYSVWNPWPKQFYFLSLCWQHLSKKWG